MIEITTDPRKHKPRNRLNAFGERIRFISRQRYRVLKKRGEAVGWIPVVVGPDTVYVRIWWPSPPTGKISVRLPPAPFTAFWGSGFPTYRP